MKFILFSLFWNTATVKIKKIRFEKSDEKARVEWKNKQFGFLLTKKALLFLKENLWNELY